MKTSNNLSTSYIQAQKHETKTQVFKHITPSDLGMVFADHGFELSSLKTGNAVLKSRRDHQTTLARYREQNPSHVDGSIEIVVKAPHLYGAVDIRLGFFRVVCLNGLTVGKTFNFFKINHRGDALNILNQSITKLMTQKNQLIQYVDDSKKTVLDIDQAERFSHSAMKLRIPESVSFIGYHGETPLTLRRQADSSRDLWTLHNVIEENLTRYGVQYIGEFFNPLTQKVERKIFNTRKMRENTQANVQFNAQLFDLATSYLKGL